MIDQRSADGSQLIGRAAVKMQIGSKSPMPQSGPGNGDRVF